MSIDPDSAMKAVEAALGDAPTVETAPGALSPADEGARSPHSQPVSQTAMDYIGTQEALEAEARDVLPYSFDTCTKDMGPLRQNLYACLTCNPPPSSESPDAPYIPAGVCYACSISCHGEHELVELFTRRNFVCDCGTTRMPTSSQCTLRVDPETEAKGVHSQEPAATNTYNKNFRNRFCSCNEFYDPQQQKGTMFQCIGLATEEEGGCGEDWWHPECLMGLPRDWYKAQSQESKSAEVKGEDKTHQSGEPNGFTASDADGEQKEEHPIPPGFPDEELFDHLVCYRCVEKAPFLKQYTHINGFISLPKTGHPAEKAQLPQIKIEEDSAQLTRKRSRDEDTQVDGAEPAAKRAKSELGDDAVKPEGETVISSCKLDGLPKGPAGPMSLLLPDDFREKMCRCKDHYLQLREYPMLLEEEETYEPPISEDGAGVNGGGSVGTGSLLERGEAALSSVDRVRAIEGVMVYNHLKDKVKDFLKPFAENGKMVSAEEIKAYFEKLRGDHEAIRDARAKQDGQDGGDDGDGEGGDGRREQSGY